MPQSRQADTNDRRRVLKLLVAAGLISPAAASAQGARTEISDEILQRAEQLLDTDFPDERLAELVPSIQRNLDFFQIVRDLDIDDLVEPPTVFRARGR